MLFKKRSRQSEALLVFLDIDGVLNTSNSFNTKYELLSNNLDALSHLVSSGERAGFQVKIILTSTWRLGYASDYDDCSPQVKALLDKLSGRGITLAGITPIYKNATRDKEISRYIREFSLSHKNFAYVTLDDDVTIYDKTKIKDIHLYKVNGNTGLTKADIIKILDMVSGGSTEVKKWKKTGI